MFVKIETNFLDVLDNLEGFPGVKGLTLGIIPGIKNSWNLTDAIVSGDYTILEYRYSDIVPKAAKDTVLPILFDNITVLSTVTAAQLSAITDPTIQLVGQIVQSEGFTHAGAAFATAGNPSGAAFATAGNPSDFKTGEED